MVLLSWKSCSLIVSVLAISSSSSLFNQKKNVVNAFVVNTNNNIKNCKNNIRCTRKKNNKNDLRLYNTVEDNNDNDGEKKDDDTMKVERDRLEAMLMGTTSSSSSSSSSVTDDKEFYKLRNWKEQIDNPPPLTSMGKKRIQTEIKLLESLVDNDDATSELWNLWYNSRGPTAAAKLKETDELISIGGPAKYKKAETLLRNLIDEEGIFFVEAVNRLATILFLQGKFDDSRTMCDIVLRIKPWHFGALSGIVMVCRGLNDAVGMAYWAKKMMPPLKLQDGNTMLLNTAGRKKWVDEMIKKARRSLEDAEDELQQSYELLDDDNDDDDDSFNNNNFSNSDGGGVGDYSIIEDDEDGMSWQ